MKIFLCFLAATSLFATVGARGDSSSSIDLIPDGSYIELTIPEHIVNVDDTSLSLGVSQSYDNVSVECHLSFTADSEHDRLIKGLLRINNVEGMVSGGGYVLNGTFLLNGVERDDLGMDCQSSDLITIGDLQEYLKSLNGTLTISPPVKF